MKKTEIIANRLREVFLNGKWIANTNFKEQIESISWKQANQQIGSLNTIALLTFHVNYYLGGILNVFNGGELEIRDKYSFDMPPVESAEDWKNLVDDFISNAEQFADKVAQMPDDILEIPFVDKRFGTYYRNLEGTIEHAYYHLGQISLIKKMILAEEK